MKCPKCECELPSTKIKKSFGGWFCPKCGLEIDKLGNSVKRLVN
jgi:ribosomal protein L37AE/L43A